MATLTPFPKSNATTTALPQSPPPPAIRSTGSRPLAPAGVTPVAPAVVTPPAQTTPFQTSAYGNQQVQPYTPTLDEGSILQGYLGQFLGADNALMRDARTRGIEAAASSGLQNSSIAAGASQRAALDVAAPLAQQAFDMFGQREGRQWQTNERLGGQRFQTGEREATQGWQTNERLGTQEWTRREEQRQRDWTADQNRLDRDQQITMSQVQNWLNNESFMREFNANLSLLPITNTTQLLNTIMQQAVDNPQVYTPDVVSGLSEFFTTNFLDVLSRYFPSMYAQTGGA